LSVGNMGVAVSQ